MESLYGKDYSEMLASLSLRDLKDEIKSLTDDGHVADTKLKLDLSGRNPDDGVTEIAYNKGYFFLRSIEEKYGREKFDAFLKDYFTQFSFQSTATDKFIDFIKSYYQTNFQITITDEHLNAWIFTEGLPKDCPQPKSDRFAKVDEATAKWRSSQKLDAGLTKDWSTHEWLHFLRSLPETLSQTQLADLDKAHRFTESGNAEIITAWLTLAIRFQYEKAYDRLADFLIHTGRRKFLSPLYNELIKTEDGKKRAQEIYAKARPNYHFVATNTFDKILH
jgi:hypothetical protein